MFHPEVIARREALLVPTLGALLPNGILASHSHDECWAMRDRLAPVVDEKGNRLRDLTKEEESFVFQERFRCKLDYRYFSERYAVVAKETADAEPLVPRWKSQELYLEHLARIEYERLTTGDPDGILVNVLKARQLGLCLHPQTRVLTADLRWIPIADLLIGAEIVAVDEHVPGGTGHHRRMRTGRVEAKREVHEPAFSLQLDNGETLVATAAHRFLIQMRGRKKGTAWKGNTWERVEHLRVGDAIRYVTKPWGPSTVEDGWIGGMLDGEGSFLNKGAGAGVCIAQVDGPVYARVKSYLSSAGYAWREEADRRKASASSKFGNRVVFKAVVQRMNDLFSLLGRTRPTRFIGRRWWEGRELPGKCSGVAWARIVSITALPAQRMIDIQTSTKTFIAEGFVSHNSTETEVILAHQLVTQTRVRGLVAGDVPEQSKYLFGMAELVVAELPWWLRPPLQFHQSGSYLQFGTGTSLRAAAGKSQRGGLQDKGGTKGNIGRGKTYQMVHLSEISTWERPEQIEDGLMPGIPRRSRTFMARESTAKGRNDYWHLEWQKAARGMGRFRNIFIPWYIEPEKYWAPYPEGWEPAPSTLQHAALVERTSPQFLNGVTMRLPKEQLYWYERTRAAFDADDNLHKFLEEYPAEPEESFQYAGRSVFNSTVLEALRAQERLPIAVLAVEPASDIAQLKAWEAAHQDA